MNESFLLNKHLGYFIQCSYHNDNTCYFHIYILSVTNATKMLTERAHFSFKNKQVT